MSVSTAWPGVSRARQQAVASRAPITTRLAEVPPSLLSEHREWSPDTPWQGSFDIAVWLRTPAGLSRPLQLALSYQDAEGEKVLPVDRCPDGAHHSVLLNGAVRLGVHGKVRDLALVLVDKSANTLVMLDEWHIVPQQKR